MTNEQDQAFSTDGLNPGDRIGKYEVRQRLGEGGQFIVYEAHDALLDRSVAIKQIVPSLAQDAHYLKSLCENLRRIARLGQKNDAIVTIHEVMEDPRGLFYVMEFVEGHTLATLIRESDGPIDPKAGLLILFRLAAALHGIHGEGLIHRDLKPGNIILTKGFRPKIIDFGIAMAGDDASMPLATTKYLAPELYDGTSADARSDLYSLGFLIYEMLLGKTEFNEVFADVIRDPHSESLRWMKWHGNKSVIAPSLHELNPAIPEALSRIVARLIEKDPDKRFRSAEDLGHAIKASFSAKGHRGAGRCPADMLAAITAQEAKHAIDDELGIESPEGLSGLDLSGLGETQEEGDSFEEPATAALPKAPMSRRRKRTMVFVGAVVLLLLLGTGVGWMIHIHRLREARATSATGLFDDGSEFYQAGRYGQALEKLEVLRKRYPAASQSAKASVLALICRARLAVQDRQWRQAQLYEDDARAAAEDLQETSKSKALDEWVRQQLQSLEELSKLRLSSNTFWNAFEEVQQRLPKAIGETDLDAVLKLFKDTVGAADVVLTSEQEALAAALVQDILRRKCLVLFDGYLAKGDALLQETRFEAADAAYGQAAEMLGEQDEMVRAMSPQQRGSLLAAVASKRSDLRAQQRSRQAFEAVLAAEKQGDRSGLRAALRHALRVDGLPPADRENYMARLLDLEVEEAVEATHEHLAAERYDLAKATLQQVLHKAPGDKRLMALAKEVQMAADRSAFIQAGDQAALKFDFAEAMKQYAQAAKLGSDDTLKRKICDAQYEIEIQRASRLSQAGMYDQAEEAYRRARKIKPSSHAQVEALLVVMRARRQYEQFLRQGDEQRRKKKWRDAIRYYNQAKDRAQDTREVDERISETHYERHLTDGKEALREENYPMALWHFKQAQRYKDTPEVRSLLEQASAEVQP